MTLAVILNPVILDPVALGLVILDLVASICPLCPILCPLWVFLQEFVYLVKLTVG